MPSPKYYDFSNSQLIVFDTETKDPQLREFGAGTFRKDGYIIGFSLADETGFADYYNVGHPDCTAAERKKNVAYLRDVMRLPQDKVGVNTQYDVDWIENSLGFRIEGNILDCSIAEALLDENLDSFSLDTMAFKYLGKKKAKARPEAICEANGWKGDFRQHLWRMPYADVYEYGKADAAYPAKIIRIQQKLLAAQELEEVFQLECDITRILVEMRRNGVRIDMKKRQEHSDALHKAIEDRKKHLEKHYGKFNYNSSKQVATILDAMGAPYARRETTGNPILDAHALKALSEEYPVCKDIIELKKIDKILSTFIDGSLHEGVAPDGRIHATFYNTKTEREGGMAGTRSGRFSCIAEGTPVTTARGEVPINEVLPGDIVLTHRGNWAEVQQVLDQGMQAVVRLTTAANTSIICTRDHRFFTPQGWERADRLQEVYIVSEQDIAKRRSALPQGCGDVPRRSSSNCSSSSEAAQYRYSHSTCDATTGALRRDATSGVQQTAGTNQARGAKSNERCFRGSSPQLEGDLLRQEGTLHDDSRWQTILRAPARYCRLLWHTYREALSQHNRTPYRWGPLKQRYRQPSDYYTERTYTSRTAPKGSLCPGARAVRASVKPAGVAHVYDLVLAHEDHSFAASSHLTHNCSSPNLQQIPSYDSKEKDDFKRWYTKLCRELFLPEEDHWWLKIDYSQIEYRFMAHFACNAGPDDTSADDVRRTYNENPYTDYHEMIQELTGLPRKLAKNLNFGVGYGMGKGHMSEFFGWTPDYCDEVLTTYHSRAPFVKATMNAVSMKGRAQGFVRTFLKRRSRLTDPRKAYILFCRLCQGSAADLTKQAMVNAWKAGIFDVLPLHLTVHDELDNSMPKTLAGIEAGAELKYMMENALTLRVPIIAEAEYGDNWVDLKDFDKTELIKEIK